MNIYKFSICIVAFLCIFSINYAVFADDELFEDDSDIFDFIESSSPASTEPIIDSRAAIVYDRASGSVLFGKNENEKRKMASTTKIMTAIIVLENSKLDDIVTISSKSANTGGSRLGLHTDDKISVLNLLYGLLLCSGNDAAVALAEHTGGDIEGFANLMNKKCSELGLNNSHFVTPHGLDDDEHYTTAYELAKITDYALKNKTFVELVSTKNYTISINGYSKSLSNTNELLGVLDGVYGVKTGFTNGANRCLVTSVKRNNMDIICIVLGADTKKDRTRDSIKLIEYVFNNFKLVNIKDMINTEFENWKSCNKSSFDISKGISNTIDIKYDELPYDFLPVNCNFLDNVCIYIYCNSNLKAPLSASSKIGYIAVSINNKNVLTLNITNTNPIYKKSFTDFYSEMLKNYIYNLESIFFSKPS